jgi:hypothetical protein
MRLSRLFALSADSVHTFRNGFDRAFQRPLATAIQGVMNLRRRDQHLADQERAGASRYELASSRRPGGAASSCRLRAVDPRCIPHFHATQRLPAADRGGKGCDAACDRMAGFAR